jgi:hypothetical protein
LEPFERFWNLLEGFGTFWKMAGEFEFEIKIEFLEIGF